MIAFRLCTCAGVRVRSLSVLLIEDDALVALLLEDLLAEMGHVVCATAATEIDAINAARHHRPDLMISDVRLHSGNGISAVAKILRDRPVPHIFLSGDAAGVLECRPDAIVLRKPFRPAALADALERALKAATPI